MSRSRSRIVLVTGSSRGIGRACAIAFAEDGAAVVINHPGESEAAEETAQLVRERGGKPLVVQADVGSVQEVRRLGDTVEREFGRVDVVVLNAGICPFTPFLEIDESEWDRVHAINLKGVFFLAQTIAPMMMAARSGRFIAVSSLSALRGEVSEVHYCASKAGVLGLMRALAVVLGPYGITCNAVLPGPVETDINREWLAETDRRSYFEGRIPFGRIGEPIDIARAVRLLASDDASYITGAAVSVDGGLAVQL
jgi:L-rhamnose 1-dehydrogenase